MYRTIILIRSQIKGEGTVGVATPTLKLHPAIYSTYHTHAWGEVYRGVTEWHWRSSNATIGYYLQVFLFYHYNYFKVSSKDGFKLYKRGNLARKLATKQSWKIFAFFFRGSSEESVVFRWLVKELTASVWLGVFFITDRNAIFFCAALLCVFHHTSFSVLSSRGKFDKSNFCCDDPPTVHTERHPVACKYGFATAGDRMFGSYSQQLLRKHLFEHRWRQLLVSKQYVVGVLF